MDILAPSVSPDVCGLAEKARGVSQSMSATECAATGAMPSLVRTASAALGFAAALNESVGRCG